MREDLPAQEAVFGGEVAFDVGKAQHPVRFLVRQQQRGQAAHRVSDQVKTPDARVIQHGQCRLDQERDRDAPQILAVGLAAFWCVVGEERAPGEGGLAGDVKVVLLRRAEAMQAGRPDVTFGGLYAAVHDSCGVSAVFERLNWCPSPAAAPRVCTYTPGRSSSPETGRTCRFVRPASLDHILGRSQRGRHCSL